MRLRQLGSWVFAVSVIAACSARGTNVYIAPADASVEDRGTMVTDDVQVVACAMPQTMCNGACVDTSASVDHCGSCGNRCATGQNCVSGSCRSSSTCGSPRVMCGSTCADLSSDTSNCGSCGRACASGQTCNSGTCFGGGGCAPPRTMCDVCTDIQTDSNNCGLCGFRCPTGETCVGGACRTGSTGCVAPRSMCSTGCTNVASDALNCGSCGNRCATGQTCSTGFCTSTMSTASAAGSACLPDDSACLDPLACQDVGARGFCTGVCEDGTTASEQAQCGGRGSTCLTQGDPGTATARSFCTHACLPGARSEATGACRAGTVCTGWWYTHAAGGDDPGCFPFCGANSDCAAPTGVCNRRTGSCGTTGVDMTRLADGAACNPMITVTVPGEDTPRNIQCRGICFGISSTNRTQGLCGSFINLGAADTTGCPDTPAQIEPRAGASAGEDNLGICIFRTCLHNSECGAGLLCIYPESMGTPVTTTDRLCQYATAAQPMGVL